MHASVTPANGVAPAFTELVAGGIVLEQTIDLCAHLIAIANAEVVLSWTKKALRIVPRRAQQGRAASKSFKNSNGWNATQTICVMPPRHMQRQSTFTVCLGSVQVGQVPAIFNAGFLQGLKCQIGIADAVRDHFATRQAGRWAHSKLHQLL